MDKLIFSAPKNATHYIINSGKVYYLKLHKMSIKMWCGDSSVWEGNKQLLDLIPDLAQIRSIKDREVINELRLTKQD